MFLATSKDLNKCFIMKDSVIEYSGARMLSTSGFVECNITEQGYHGLRESGWTFFRNVQIPKGDVVVVKTLWEPMPSCLALQHTFDVIGNVDVGHVYHAVSLLKKILQPGVKDWKTTLHQSEEWKYFVLNSWIEQISMEESVSHCLSWQKLLEECFHEFQTMLPDLLSFGKTSIAKIMQSKYISHSVSSNMFADEKKVYTSNKTVRYKCMDEFSAHVGFLEAKKHFYTAVLGYIPHDNTIPKNIEMARTLAIGMPPPFTRSPNLWKFFGITPPHGKDPLVTINYCTPFNNGREFGVISPAILDEFLASNDVSAGEILSNDLWVTALTFDLDGKTLDVRMHSSSIYETDKVLHDLVSATRDVTMEELKGRWDMYKHRPAIHAWRADSKEKLSMRISVHLPENVAFVSVDAIQGFVRKLVLHIRKTKCRYITVLYVTTDKSLRFEMSITDGNYWCGTQGDKVIRLEDHIKNETKSGGTIDIKCRCTSYTLWKSHSSGYMVQENGVKSIVFDLVSWIACVMKKNAFVETFIDESIYTHNHSIRLPGQSKISDGRTVRKFQPCTQGSMPTDALMHYDHKDTPPLPGSPILVKGPEKNVIKKAVESEHTSEDMEIISEFIAMRYHMKINKSTVSGNKVYLDVTDGNGSCLVKGGPHTNAKMFLVYDKITRDLLAHCWSSKCKEKLRLRGNERGLHLCNAAHPIA